MNYFRFRRYNEDLGHTPVENIFINHYMPQAPGDYVKIYLLGLKCSYSQSNSCLSDDTIAKTVGVSVEEVKKAWKYWESLEIIRLSQTANEDGNFIEYLDIKEIVLNIKGDDKKPGKYSADRIVQARRNNKIKDMFDYIRRISGRELSQNEIFAFLDWIDDYGFPPEVVMMIIDDCYSRNKKDLPYLKQVARNWFDAGVNSKEKALEYGKRHKEKWQKYGKVLSFLRIGRQPTVVEEEMLFKWFYEYSFSDEVILKACELTVKTLKPSFSYIDRTLTQWHEKDLKSIEEVEAYILKTAKSPKKSGSKSQKSTFDNFSGRTYDAELLKQKLLKKSRGETID